MLIAESEMNEADSHYIESIDNFLGFHLCTALQRLGRKVVSLKHSAKYEMLPVLWLDNLEASSVTMNSVRVAYFFCDANFARNTSPDQHAVEKSLVQAKKISKENPSAKIIFALPINTPPSVTEKIRQNFQDSIILLSPALFGFGDQNLMDKLIKESSHFVPAIRSSVENCDLLLVSEAVGFLVSASNITTILGKTLKLPITTRSTSEVIGAFERYCRTPQKLAKFLRKFRKPILSLELNPSQTVHPEAEEALQYFPLNQRSTDLSLQACARLLKQKPFMGMHFPPSKGL